MKNKRGITLISLVVTIIILLILAGLTMNIIMGENGILEKAKQAKIEQEISKYIEDIELFRGELAIDNLGKVSLSDLIQKIEENDIIPGGKITKINEQRAEVLTKEGYKIIITDKNTISEGITELVTEIVLNKTNLTIEANTTETLLATIYPTNATNKDIEWISDNPNIATVSNGIINAKSEGTVTITAMAKDTSGKNAKCTVEVFYPTLSSKAKIGDYIQYDVPDKTYNVTTSETGYANDQEFDTKDATNLWQILYNDEEKGLQITSSKSVGTLAIGTAKNVTKTRIAYNNIITTLNDMSNKYINTNYAISARSIGSNPSDSKDGISGLYKVSSSWPTGSYTGFKVTDTYYTEDETAMKKATNQKEEGISNIGERYFLASRYVYADAGNVIFYVRSINTSGNIVNNYYYIQGCSDGAGLSTSFAKTCSSGVRPVITLIQDIKVKKGKGTVEEPYILQPKQ